MVPELERMWVLWVLLSVRDWAQLWAKLKVLRTAQGLVRCLGYWLEWLLGRVYIVKNQRTARKGHFYRLDNYCNSYRKCKRCLGRSLTAGAR